MANNFWGRLRGGLANIVADGKVYNRYTGQYAPGSVQAARYGSAGLSQLGPLGSLAGMLWKGVNDGTYAAGQFDAGINLGQWQAANRRPDANQLGLDVPDVGMTGYERGHALNAPQAQMPTMPTVTAQADGWNGGLGTSNAFNSGLGNWINQQPQARSYGQSGGSFTPWGAGVVQVAGQGWGGSDAAAGFGVGAQGAGGSSGGSFALADAMAAAKKNRA